MKNGRMRERAGRIVSWWPARQRADVAGRNPGTGMAEKVSYNAGEVAQRLTLMDFPERSGSGFGQLDVGNEQQGFTVECWIKPR